MAREAHPSMAGELELLRARLYTLLAQMLARPPTAGLLGHIADLRGTATPLGAALDALAQEAATATEAEARREHDVLFIGVDRGELVPYASFYLTGFLNDRPLARLRRDLMALRIERAPGVAEPEDHIASLCEVMAGLITGAFEAPPGLDQQRFFAQHLEPWAERFFTDLERAGSARLYRPLGSVGRIFMTIEADAWAMTPAPLGERSGVPADRSVGAEA